MSVRGALQIIWLSIGVHAGAVAPSTAAEHIPQVEIREAVAGDAHGTLSGPAVACDFTLPTSPLDVVEVIDRALCNNPKTAGSWALVKQRAHEVGIARAAYYPQISASVGAARLGQEVFARGIFSNQATYSTLAPSETLSIQLTLLDFGLRAAQLSSARATLAAARASYQQTLESAVVEVAEAYYDVVDTRARLETNQRLESLALDNVAASEHRYGGGAVQISDVLLAHSSYSRAKVLRIADEGNAAAAQDALVAMMGLNGNVPVVVKIEGHGIFGDLSLQSVGELIEEAKQRSPSLRAANAELAGANADLKAAKASGRPSVALQLGLTNFQQLYSQGSTALLFGVNPSNITRDTYGTITINLPMFQGLSHMHAVRAAQAKLAARMADVRSAEYDVTLYVIKRVELLRAALEEADATGTLTGNAAEFLNAAQERYKLGAGSMLEIIAAQREVSDSELERIQALSTARRAAIELAGVLGRLSSLAGGQYSMGLEERLDMQAPLGW